MSSYKITYNSRVIEQDIPPLPRNIQIRIFHAIEERLATQPTKYGVRLRRSLSGLWRLRVGDYRIIYEIKGRTIRIWAIGHRKNAYDEIARIYTEEDKQ